jgi:hypothetical protein
MINFRFIVRLATGSLLLISSLLIAPANIMAMEPGTDRKLVALKLMVLWLAWRSLRLRCGLNIQ